MYHIISWFHALSRLRQLIPGTREDPELGLLLATYRIASALKSAGITVVWHPSPSDTDFPPRVMSAPFHGIVVAESLLFRRVPAIEVNVPNLIGIDRELGLFDGGESVLLSLTVPTLQLHSHEDEWTECVLSTFSEDAEDPSRLRQAYLAKLTSAQDSAMGRTPPHLRTQLIELCAKGQKLEAIRVYMAHENCTLDRASADIGRLCPWWPPEPEQDAR